MIFYRIKSFKKTISVFVVVEGFDFLSVFFEQLSNESIVGSFAVFQKAVE